MKVIQLKPISHLKNLSPCQPGPLFHFPFHSAISFQCWFHSANCPGRQIKCFLQRWMWPIPSWLLGRKSFDPPPSTHSLFYSHTFILTPFFLHTFALSQSHTFTLSLIHLKCVIPVSFQFFTLSHFHSVKHFQHFPHFLTLSLSHFHCFPLHIFTLLPFYIFRHSLFHTANWGPMWTIL